MFAMYSYRFCKYKMKIKHNITYTFDTCEVLFWFYNKKNVKSKMKVNVVPV